MDVLCKVMQLLLMEVTAKIRRVITFSHKNVLLFKKLFFAGLGPFGYTSIYRFSKYFQITPDIFLLYYFIISNCVLLLFLSHRPSVLAVLLSLFPVGPDSHNSSCPSFDL